MTVERPLAPHEPQGPQVPPEPLAPFRALMAQDDARIELARACLMIARDAYPALDVAHYVGEIERLGLRLRARLSQHGRAEKKVIALNEFIFGELGFEGNVDAYYDPRNSYLNDVIDRRTGIPISLSILYVELGRRIGLPLEGVSFPGHFLVRLRLRGGMLVLDPFAGSPRTTCASASRASCRRRRPAAFRSMNFPWNSFLRRRRTARSSRVCCAT